MRLNFQNSTLFKAFIILIAVSFTAIGGFTDSTVSLKDPEGLKALKYRSIGPGWGGRVSRAAGVPGNANVFYFGGAASGVWKSSDGGTNWKSVFDEQPISSIGSLSIAPSQPEIIYVGAGEANTRGNVAAGNGIYKSVDAGKTWTHVWKQEGQIGTMVVHPDHPDIAFAAVLGHAFGPNAERGVYRTKDGGKTWQQILKKDQDTGASDVALDPSNPNIVFAGLWQMRRYPWGLTSGGRGSGLYMSRDGGDTWKQLTEKGLPEGIWGKVGVAVAPSDGRRVYALIEAEQGGLFRSDDGGENWTRISTNRLVRQRAWYYSVLTVHPSNPNEIWVPQVPMLKSIDGGKTFQYVKGLHHGDHHDLWIDPRNPKRMIASNDGGVDVSNDGGETWFAPALPIAQFYHVNADSRVPFHVAGGIQDIGTAQGPSRSLTSAGIRNGDWYPVGGGEAGYAVSNTADPNLVYAGEYGGYISLYDHRTRQARNISVVPGSTIGHDPADMKYRFQWTAPIATSPHNPKVVYHGGNVLFRTDDAGHTWKAISPDLTRNDKSKQQWSGGPITGDNTGAETYCTIFAVAESPVSKGLIWVGSDDGLVHVTRDDGKNWKNVTKSMPGFPDWGTVSSIEPSRKDAGIAYVVVDAHRLDNMKPYLYKTTDSGDSWKRLDSGLPQDVYLHSVREDPQNPNILYIGTERGVAYTTDGGKTWQSLKLNLPTVAVHDLAVKDNSLVVGTLGRSIWIFDHLGILKEMNSDVTAARAHLFRTADAVAWRYSAASPDTFTGENPPAGAVFYYWLKEAPKNDITVEILDSSNKVINTLSSKPKPPLGISDDLKQEEEDAKKAALPKEKGVQMGVWPTTYSGGEMITGAKVFGNTSSGPGALAGNYTLRLTVDGQSYTQGFKVLPDPRVQTSEADLKEQRDLALTLRDDVTQLTQMVLQIQGLRQQLKQRNELLKSNSKAAGLLKDSDALIQKLDALEAKLHNPKAEVVYDLFSFKGGAQLYSRIAVLYGYATDSDGRPTEAMRHTAAEQKEELQRFQSEWKQLQSQDLANLNNAARNLDVPIILVPQY